jgi:hypothetical protein
MKYLGIICGLCLYTMAALAQTGTIKGRIFNETNNESLPFANMSRPGFTD